jgi:hypothetical protein
MAAGSDTMLKRRENADVAPHLHFRFVIQVLQCHKFVQQHEPTGNPRLTRAGGGGRALNQGTEGGGDAAAVRLGN